ncbi:murein biosynthesis integral membrane protein MurJ [Curtobacterium sp. UNCCL20]|uniref:murein biosynthesis integral membrane protein MurJ n=1 Tax=Curtobacterium sp. UNCCL20 TaxID=1502773 RepID=UPI00088A970D|nr:murein biosynthesis integral membrane protein MurJ [Curtobacterium sp. UNCCL20]SDQ15239.1 murein biosynthesis integral membrane protein MurJ [Curtobacterium sp. UNCCL20]
MQIFRTTLAAAATALVALGLVVAPAQADGAHATTVSTTTSRTAHPAAAEQGKTTISIAPANRGVVRRDEDLELALTITNDTDSDVPAGTADLEIFRSVSTRDVLSDWLADTSTTGYLGAPMDSVDVPAVPAHRSVTLDSVKIVSGNVALGGYSSFGARRIAAEYTAGDTYAVARSAITWYPDSSDQTPVSVSVAMPITVPRTGDGILGAGVLAASTAVDGTLTQQLLAAEDHNVAVAVDPRIIASIRILGADAPSSATAWLSRLESLRNETFALPYADADVTGLRQSGANGILSPISLDQAVDPDHFPGASTPTPTPTSDASTPAADATATATPSDEAAADRGATGDGSGDQTDGSDPGNPDDQTPSVLPTTQTLLDFPYSMDGIAWPADGTVTAADLPALAKAGTKTTILSSGNTSAGADTTIAASEQIGSQHVLVSDQSMSALLRTAATATTQQAWNTAISELTATLATSARANTAEGPVLLTLDREWPTNSDRLSQTLDAIESTAWVAPADLSTASAATPGSLTLTAGTNGDTRTDQLERLVRGEQDLSAFASALDTPTDLTAPARLNLLALSSNSWRADPDGFATAVNARVASWAKAVSEVGIVDSSSLTLLGDRSSLPISIRNSSKYPVTVRLAVQPSNSALRVVRNDIEVKIQPESSTRTTVPVQSVANGKVNLTMSLTSPTGIKIASPATVELNVQAQWETVITAAAAVALFGIFGFGIFRSIRKRIRRRNGELDDEDDDDPNRLLEVQPVVGGAPLTAASAPDGRAPLLQADTAPRDEPSANPEEPTISATQPQPAVDAEPVAERSLGRASAMLAAGTMVSRILGFAKTFVLAFAIGNTGSDAANAFAISNQLPNNIYALIAGGLLSAVLIPQIVRSMQQHTDGGTAYVNKIVTLGGSAFLVITVVATLLAPVLVRVYSQSAGDGGKGFSAATTDLAVAFAFWCLPQILFYAMYSLLGEVLNAKQVFGPFTWAPLLNNVIAIAGLIVFIAMFGGRAVNASTDDWTPLKIAVLAGSASVGVFAQAAFLPLFWRRAGLRFRPDFRWRGVGLKSTGTAAGWLFAMILVTQLAGVVQARVASLATGAGNATLSTTWLLFMLPHSIITVSIATAYFTRMSHDAERGDLGAVRRNLSLSLRIVGLFTVFATVALIVTAMPFARIWENEFGHTQAMALVLVAYMPGLVLFSMLFIIQRVFWAMHDHRTPFLMQLVQSGLFVIGALSVAMLPGSVIGVGIAICTTIAGSAQTIVALVLVRKRLGGIEGPIVTRSHVQFIIAALIAGVAGLLVANFFGAFSADGFAMADVTGALITLALTGAVMVVVYFGALVVAKNGEIQNAVAILRSRLGR